MPQMLDAVLTWPSLVLVIVMFGFAPGFCLRFIVLAYPRGDPRRNELIAELYAVPRVERPFWVVEQLEVALTDGLLHRVLEARRRRLASYGDRRRALEAQSKVLTALAEAETALKKGDVARFSELFAHAKDQLAVIAAVGPRRPVRWFWSRGGERCRTPGRHR